MATAKILWRADELGQQAIPFEQRLNPGSGFLGTPLSRLAGLQRAHVSLARIPPGKDSFACHAHLLEEEWVYVLAGRGLVELDGADQPVGPGDFLGFPAGAPAHLLKNRGAEELVYLMGGEKLPLDVLEYPHLGKRFLLVSTPGGTEFYELGAPTRPFHAGP